MDNEKIGRFISDLRKENHMTQKELAAKLNITDKAVSKWERGLNYPDISILSSVADALGVTTSELLNGDKNGDRNNSNNKEDEINIDNALCYADKTTQKRLKSLRNVSTIIFSGILLIGIAVCIICDLAINGTFTWSLYPISAAVFGWLVFAPILKYGKKGIVGMITALSIFTIPFLYILNAIIKSSTLLLPIGIRISIITILYLWTVFAVFRILKTRKFLAGAIVLLEIIPLDIFINISTSKFMFEPWLDAWDIGGFIIIVMVAVFLLIAEVQVHKK